jgi:hypothetical protein
MKKIIAVLILSLGLFATSSVTAYEPPFPACFPCAEW